MASFGPVLEIISMIRVLRPLLMDQSCHAEGWSDSETLPAGAE